MEDSIFEKYLEQFTNTVDFGSFLINIVVAALLTTLLRFFYIKYGTSISNRQKFADIFLPLALGTLLIITIIQSSVALSLGLVGALSIVRFRAAIKEPEELTFLFLVIGVGLATGANKPILATLAILVILILLWLGKLVNKHKSFKTEDKLYINIYTDQADLQQLSDLLTAQLPYVELKRLDSLDNQSIDVSFICKAENITQLDAVRKSIIALSDKTRISIIDQPNLII